MKLGIGSDHAGYELKIFLKDKLKKEGFEVIDYGTKIKKSVDYPDFAEKVSMSVIRKAADRGILICGTGLGMSMTANKFKGIRAARCCTVLDAQLAREHNDANIITLGGRLLGKVCKDILAYDRLGCK